MAEKEVILSNGITVFLDDNIQPTSCRSCNKIIWFARTAYNRHMPITKNENGEWISHFQDCPAAKYHRKGCKG